MKRVVIIGGGISGTFAAIRIKEKHPDYHVSIFEANDKLLKKIYATGNGKCNFANSGSLKDKYNDSFALSVIEEFNDKSIADYFSSIGMKSKKIGELYYPYSESAETVANYLLKRVEELNIDIHLSSKVKDYNDDVLSLDNETYPYDVLIISVGGQSSPNLGSDGNLYQALIRHGYEWKTMSPSLCPIKTKENTKMVEGLRSKAHVSLYQGHYLIHEEDGELLFKKDGLSGMVIFNMTHFINGLENKNDIKIHVDFAKNMDGDIDSLVHPKIAKYLKDNHLNVHDTIFTFKDFYGFENSQVSSGGISLNNLNNTLGSKKEPNVYFIGEVVDIDAVCGGFNIMWALASANLVSKNV